MLEDDRLADGGETAILVEDDASTEDEDEDEATTCVLVDGTTTIFVDDDPGLEAWLIIVLEEDRLSGLVYDHTMLGYSMAGLLDDLAMGVVDGEA